MAACYIQPINLSSALLHMYLLHIFHFHIMFHCIVAKNGSNFLCHFASVRWWNLPRGML